MTTPSQAPTLHAMFRALIAQQRQEIPDPHRERMIFGHSTLGDCLRYVTGRGWTVVGHRLDLLVEPNLTVMFAVLAWNQGGDFLAVTPVELEGRLGFGIVNLASAEADFIFDAAGTSVN